MNSKLYDAITGFVVGDALGVPDEFKMRGTFECTGMRASSMSDVHLALPLGSWSDDTSLMLCVLDALTLRQQSDVETPVDKVQQKVYNRWKSNAIAWMTHGKFTNHGYLIPYDIGNSCRRGITAMMLGHHDKRSDSANANGNGGLMRILPLAFCQFADDEELMDYIKLINKCSHNHQISHVGSFIYTKLVQNAANSEQNLAEILENTVKMMPNEYLLPEYERIWDLSILDAEVNTVASTGYVVHTLEAAIWSVATSNSYTEAVLKAVNLGEDTDTVAAIAGGLAAVVFGGVPEEWIRNTRKQDKLQRMCAEFEGDPHGRI